MSEDVEINSEWTLESMKKTFNNEPYGSGDCYACRSVDKSIKAYIIGAKSKDLMWSDKREPVWEKVRVQYCDECAKELMAEIEKSMEEVAQK